MVGAGRMGSIHANAYKRNPKADLIAVCDVEQARADNLAVTIGARSYASLSELLELEQPDVVSICTDASYHREAVLAALDAGAHVLCEKPMSGYLHDIEVMMEKANQRGRRLGANFNHRFARVAQKAKEHISLGHVGEICFVHMWLTIAVASEVSDYFHLRSLHGHSFDMLRYLAGDIAEVHGFLSKSSGRKYFSNCSIGCRFESGGVGAIVGSYEMSNLHPMERVEVGGTKGRLVLDNVTAGLTFYRHDKEEFEAWVPVNYTRHAGQTEYDFNRTVEHRIDAFLHSILRNEEDAAPAQDAWAATRLIEATIESFEEGRVVKLSGSEHANSRQAGVANDAGTAKGPSSV